MGKSYSERAKRILSLAQSIGCQEGSQSIKPRHLMIALIIEDQGPEMAKKLLAVTNQTARDSDTVLTNVIPRTECPFFTFDRARMLLAKLRLGTEPGKTHPQPALAPDTQAILSNAWRFKDNLRHRTLKPAHIFAASFVTPGPVSNILRECGFDENDALGATLFAALQS